MLFLDTNALLTATGSSRPNREAARNLLHAAVRNGFHAALSGQIGRERLVVARRPVENNGLGLGASDALKDTGQSRRFSVFCDETQEVSKRLPSLVSARGLTGSRIHDATVAATAPTHRVSVLVTDHARDFDALAGLDVLTTSQAVRAVAAAEPRENA